jgi:hypothetical protein
MAQELKLVLGQQVTVTNSGKAYSGYEGMATLMRLAKWAKWRTPENGSEGTVVAISKHEGSDVILVGINIDGKEYIISQDGVEDRSAIALQALTEKRAKLEAELEELDEEIASLN